MYYRNSIRLHAGQLGVPLTLCVPRKLPNEDQSREEDIFIVQSRCSDVNDNLMELLILMSACKTASTRRITRHYPAFSLGADGQGRRLVANMLACAGCDHIITIDLHTSQIQRFFDIPRIDRWPNSIAVSPDVGGTKRVTAIADKLGIEFPLIRIQRATLIDDMIDTGRTLTPAARTLHNKDVKTIHVLIWYGSCLRMNDKIVTDPMVGLALPIEELVVTKTCTTKGAQRECSKIRAIDISAIIAESIQRTYNGESIDLLFGD
ncbi:phosphoribosyltransferase-like protein [Pisolithus sp. B1]|nr:phosphoribosyltransferase-like protein [Pisolithus sp. B1]